MANDTNTARAGLSGLARFVIEAWALLGGALLLAVVLMTAWSVTASAVLGAPVPGDYELVQMGVAIAAFSFLPYCQLSGANVTADIFTSGASPRWIAFFTLLAALVALGFSAILIWRMQAGLADYMEYEELTPILNVPHWWAYLPILVSLALLALASLDTVIDASRGMVRRGRG
jgi:TRAP-type C4-dicarboxylate transport system permease small subunit